MTNRLGHATLDLALNILRINRTADIVCCHYAGQGHLTGLFVHLHFHNLRAKGVQGLGHTGRERATAQDGTRAACLGIAHELTEGKTTIWRAFHKDAPTAACQVCRIGFEAVRGKLQQLFTGICSRTLDGIPDRDCDATGRRRRRKA